MASIANTPKSAIFGPASDAKSNIDQFARPSKLIVDPNVGPGGATFADSMWSFASADELALNWDKSFPYQLLLLNKVGTGYVQEAAFTLPIPPSALNISTPFAINVSVTQGGILEEHNGAPMRTISLQGTTGFLPLRGNVTVPSIFTPELDSIFAGTVTGVNKILTAVSQASNLLPGVQPAARPHILSDQEMASENNLKGTGYYQFQLLKRFFEAYVNRKKNGDSNLRMGFAIWKESEIYLVTPVSFDVPRNAGSPMEYPFSLVFKAWKRISNLENNTGTAYHGAIGVRNPNVLATVLNAIGTARLVLEGAKSTLEGVRADVHRVLYEPLRQTMLFGKDAIGVTLTAVDLPANIISDLQEPILEAASASAGPQQPSRLGKTAKNGISAKVKAIQEAFKQLAVLSGKSDSGAGTPLAVRRDASKGVPQKDSPSPAVKVMQNPGQHYSFFSDIKLSELNMRPHTIRKIEEERNKTRVLRRQDFEKFRDQTLRLLADFSDSVGAGDATYTSTYSLPVRTSTRTPTDSEWDIIYSLSSLAQQYDTMAASANVNRDQITSLDYVAGLATRSGIAFKVPKSKFAIPFPYNHTLEQISYRYLKTPDRWHEIAALNGLRAPYVDEVGFKLYLPVTGNGTQIVVSDASNLYVGQKVWLQSGTVKRESRRIQKITDIGANQWALTLDGDPDLVKFNINAEAYLQAFLPGTVNSQQQLYIPSDNEPQDVDHRVKDIPGVNYFDPLVRSGGIDLLLDQNGDIVITPEGDSRLAVGLTNLIQKVRLALGTRQGELLHHPDYGIGLIPGTSTADLSADGVLQSIKQFFKSDPGFLGVQSVSISKSAGVMTISASIGIAGTGKYMPIQVEFRG